MTSGGRCWKTQAKTASLFLTSSPVACQASVRGWCRSSTGPEAAAEAADNIQAANKGFMVNQEVATDDTAETKEHEEFWERNASQELIVDYLVASSGRRLRTRTVGAFAQID